MAPDACPAPDVGAAADEERNREYHERRRDPGCYPLVSGERPIATAPTASSSIDTPGDHSPSRMRADEDEDAYDGARVLRFSGCLRSALPRTSRPGRQR